MKKGMTVFYTLIIIILLIVCGCSEDKDPKVKWMESSKTATTLFQEGKYADSIKVSQDALQFAEKNFSGADQDKVAISYFNLASGYYMIGKLDDALQLFNKALSINSDVKGKDDPSVADTLKAIALIDYKQNRLSQAKEEYQKAVSIYLKAYGNSHPSVPTILANLAEINRKQCRLDEAIQLYQAALKLQPDNKNTRKSLDETIADRKNIESIIIAIKEELLLKPNAYQLEWRLGNLYQIIDNVPEALSHYEKALSIKPDYFDSLLDSASLYLKQSEYQKAIEAYTKSFEKNNERADVVYALVKSYSKNNDKQNALIWLKKLVEMGFKNWKQLEDDNDLINVKNESEYQAVIKQMKG